MPRALDDDLDGGPQRHRGGEREPRRRPGDIDVLVRRVGVDRRGVGPCRALVAEFGELGPEALPGVEVVQCGDDRDELPEAPVAELRRHGGCGDPRHEPFENGASARVVEGVAEGGRAVEHECSCSDQRADSPWRALTRRSARGSAPPGHGPRTTV